MYRHWKLVALAAAVCILLVPAPHLLRPEWDVRVVDENGNAVEGMNVRLVYQDYSLESTSHEETHTTDADGHTSFAAESTTSTVGARVAGAVRSFGATGFHASVGRYAYLVVFGKGRRPKDPYERWTGWSSSKQSRIVTTLDSGAQ